MSGAGWIRVVFGFITAMLGTTPLLAVLGVLPTGAPHPGDAPGWIGAAVGLAFFLAGMAMMVRGFTGSDDSSPDLSAATPRPVKAIYRLMTASIAVLLTVLLSWVAFGPGTRHFTMSGGVAGIAVAHAGGGDLFGRIAFGVGAILAWIVIGAMLVTARHRWR